MKHIKKRISKIVDELITYFFHIGSQKMAIKINEEPTYFQVTFNCNVEEVDNEEIDKLVKCLNCKKLVEMEEYYWELTGESDSDTELSIVGMMIDQYELTLNDHDLTLVLIRNKDK